MKLREFTQCRYLDSKFLTRGNEKSISRALIEILHGLDNRNCLKLSMDGPNTNWPVLDKESSHRQQMELPSFFDNGSRGLPTVHGTFQTGAVVYGNFLRTRLPEGTLTSPLPALRIFPSVFVKPARLKMKKSLQRLLKFCLLFYK